MIQLVLLLSIFFSADALIAHERPFDQNKWLTPEIIANAHSHQLKLWIKPIISKEIMVGFDNIEFYETNQCKIFDFFAFKNNLQTTIFNNDVDNENNFKIYLNMKINDIYSKFLLLLFGMILTFMLIV